MVLFIISSLSFYHYLVSRSCQISSEPLFGIKDTKSAIWYLVNIYGKINLYIFNKKFSEKTHLHRMLRPAVIFSLRLKLNILMCLFL